MATWSVLFAVSVEHDYFENRRCSCLRFVPTESTIRLMNNSGLLLRPTEDGIQILYENEKKDVLRSFAEDNLSLVFKVYAEDENYRSYSRPLADPGQGGLLYFDNTKASDDGSLNCEQYVSLSDMRAMDFDAFADVLDGRDKLLPPLFVMKITTDAGADAPLQQWLQPGLSKYHINFAVNEVFWKYYLFGRMADDNTYIHDPDGMVEFESLGKVLFSGQKDSYAFRSKQKIPRSERYAYRFQLMQRSAGGDRDKLIMNHLPVAGVGQFGKETIGEQSVVVSEIYINS